MIWKYTLLLIGLLALTTTALGQMRKESEPERTWRRRPPGSVIDIDTEFGKDREEISEESGSGKGTDDDDDSDDDLEKSSGSGSGGYATNEEQERTTLKTTTSKPLTPCENLREASKHLLGNYVPRCTENGDYAAMQCRGYPGTGRCWCSDRNGAEIPGTAKGPPETPDCERGTNFSPCAFKIVQHVRNPLFGSYRPRCKVNGDYDELQCHENICFCVNKDGDEIPDTAVSRHASFDEDMCKVTDPPMVNPIHVVTVKSGNPRPTAKVDPGYSVSPGKIDVNVEIPDKGTTKDKDDDGDHTENETGDTDEPKKEETKMATTYIMAKPGLLAERTTLKTTTSKPLTPCENLREASKHLLGNYVPRCTENGDYAAMQCRGYPGTGRCWCSDRNGADIPGTAKGPPETPDCERGTNFSPCAFKIVQHVRNPLFGSYRPRCKVNGDYDELQCHENICFCVNKDGDEIPDTAVSRHASFDEDMCKVTDPPMVNPIHVVTVKSGNPRPTAKVDPGYPVSPGKIDVNVEIPDKGTTKDKDDDGDHTENETGDTDEPKKEETKMATTYIMAKPGLLAERTTLKTTTSKPLTPCENLREASKHLLGNYVPRCTENGDYAAMQCRGYPGTGRCWCSDRNGAEIPGTAKGPPETPDCERGTNFSPCAFKIVQHVRNPLFGSYRPRCKVNGDYDELQCHENICFCVNKDGDEIPDTAVSRHASFDEDMCKVTDPPMVNPIHVVTVKSGNPRPTAKVDPGYSVSPGKIDVNVEIPDKGTTKDITDPPMVNPIHVVTVKSGNPRPTAKVDPGYSVSPGKIDVNVEIPDKGTTKDITDPPMVNPIHVVTVKSGNPRPTAKVDPGYSVSPGKIDVNVEIPDKGTTKDITDPPMVNPIHVVTVKSGNPRPTAKVDPGYSVSPGKIDVNVEIPDKGTTKDKDDDGDHTENETGDTDEPKKEETKMATTYIMAKPGLLAAIIGGAVVGLLCAILLVMFIVYRMRKKDEGSYALDEPRKKSAYSPISTTEKEYYA